MKKIAAIILSGVIAISLVACGNIRSEEIENDTKVTEATEDSTSGTNTESNTGSTTSGKVLIAYFAVAENSEVDATSSASVVTIDGEAKGMTEAVSDWIQEETGGKEFSIQSTIQYPAGVNDVIDQANEEQEDNIRPELTTNIENFDEYDTIYIGYPIWWYDMPQIMYSFFDKYDFSGKKIIPFSTHNGSRFSGTIETIQELEPDATVVEDGLTLSQNDVKDAKDDVVSWVKSISY